jgi:hypothetical protein
VDFFKKLKNVLFPPRQAAVKLPFRDVVSLISAYAGAKIRPQFRAVLMVSVFLAAIQFFVLRSPPGNAVSLAVCVAAAILGLSFFLEGLFLGVMPLGEQCGMRLPSKIGVAGVTVFSIVLGITATLAEPAVAVLRQQGSVIPAWDAPLLYLVLNRGSRWLVAAIAVGVGLAVVLGVYRFMFGWGFKPPVFIIIPAILGVSLVFDENPILRPLVNLAWDTGGAATGAVTVPIILAIGLGVAKIGGRSSNNSGLGLVTLASALPVASVLFLAALLGPKVPPPGDAASFFADESGRRVKAVYVAGSAEGLVRMAEEAVYSGSLSRADFYKCFPGETIGRQRLARETPVFAPRALLGFFLSALVAVLPLAFVLITAILFIARDRVRNSDIAVLGIIFAAVGMFALNLGMEGGITALSSAAGDSLRHTYSETVRAEKAVAVTGVREDSFFTAATGNGPETYIWISGKDGPTAVKFDPQRLFGDVYTHISVEHTAFSEYGFVGACLAVLSIVFLLGFLAIFAEPGLAVAAVMVEDMTTGIFRRSKLILIAAIGVGVGMSAGFARVLFSNMLPSGGIHLSWILAPCYALALILTVFAPEDFSSIAWDVAGIATGPITVPIIITAGLGQGRYSFRADGAFGIVACASVFPIIAILISGILDNMKSKRAIRDI